MEHRPVGWGPDRRRSGPQQRTTFLFNYSYLHALSTRSSFTADSHLMMPSGHTELPASTYYRGTEVLRVAEWSPETECIAGFFLLLLAGCLDTPAQCMR